MDTPPPTSASTANISNPPIKRPFNRRFAVVGLTLLCFTPLWWNYFGNLWSREAYQFFPLALAGVALLLFREYEEYPRPLEPGSNWIAGGCIFLSILMLTAATWLWSPWVGAVSVLPALAGLVWWLGGWRLFRALFPAGMLFLTIILPPLKLDEVFTLKLQNLSTIGSSWALKVLSVTHQMYGNVIEIPGHKLLVEEACSGMKSVLFTAAACIFYMSWRRRGLVVILLSMVLLLGVVMLGNLVRITSGAWLEYSYNINILSGARHETVGMIMLASYLGFILLLNVIYEKAGVPVTSKPSPPAAGLASTALGVFIPFWLRGALVLFGILFLIQIPRGLHYSDNDQAVATSPASALKNDTPINLPDEINSWWRLQSGPPSMLKVEAFGGINSQVWQYRKGRLVATISLDYPFMGYHDVQICYTSNGWQIAGQTLRSVEGESGDSPYREVTLKRDGFREATLWFSTIDEKGKWMEGNYAKSGILERFRHQFGETTTTYRMQMIIHGTEPLSETDLKVARSFYEHIREHLADYLLPKLKASATTVAGNP